MAKTLSNPTVEVNDTTIAIIPNSFSYKRGFGDRDVKSASAGGNSITIIVSENAETKISMVKFKLYNTQSNLQKVLDWATLSNTISISEDSFSIAFSDMVVTSEPEVAIGSEGDLEIEFKGRPTI